MQRRRIAPVPGSAGTLPRTAPRYRFFPALVAAEIARRRGARARARARTLGIAGAVTVALSLAPHAAARPLPPLAEFANLLPTATAPAVPVSVAAPIPLPIPVKPPVSVTRDGGTVRIVFPGILQTAPDPGGPWRDLTNASSPFTPDLTAAARAFYRARETSAGGIFSARTTTAFTVTGPLQEHFELAYAGLPDGIFPPHREKPWFAGTIGIEGRTIPANLRVRGNSSLQECPFPKLKFKVGREEREGTPFADAREIKIGTHCADGGRGSIGRLRDERATDREALAYEAMETLGFVTPRVRRAVIDYRDTSPADPDGTGPWELSRHALILDDLDVLADRLGARALADDEVARLTEADFDPQLVTDLRLFHALLGNWDFGLGGESKGIWNTEVVEQTDGRRVPIAGDFDLASWVTAYVRSDAPREYHPELGDVERQARYTVEQLRGRAKPEHFSAGRDRFLAHRNELERLVDTALVDEEGRANARRHLDAFFAALDATGR